MPQKCIFPEPRFLCMDEKKKQAWQPLITQMGRAMKKIALNKKEACLKSEDFT